MQSNWLWLLLFVSFGFLAMVLSDHHEGLAHKQLHKDLKHGHHKPTEKENRDFYRHHALERGHHHKSKKRSQRDLETSNEENEIQTNDLTRGVEWPSETIEDTFTSPIKNVDTSSSSSKMHYQKNWKYVNAQSPMPTTLRFVSKISREAELLTGDDLVNYVNTKQSLWKAKFYGHFEKFSDEAKWGLMGVNHVENSIKARKTLGESRLLDIELPTHFDAREKWPECQSLFVIRDQSLCGSCWAFGAVEAMSDRICIASKGAIQVTLSADDLLSCCRSCGYGCNGGDPLSAWKFWVTNGIVTGSNFTDRAGCRPYPFPPCHKHSNNHTESTFDQCPTHDLFPTPKCERSCQSTYTKKNYLQDKFYGEKAYAIEDNEAAIQKELITHGPMEIAFEVYEDFMSYKSGIYEHVAGKLGGGHAVKLIGWGEENGVPYWTVANSWNTEWGENGFFRILRGKDECGIESGVVAGIPNLNRKNSKKWGFN